MGKHVKTFGYGSIIFVLLLIVISCSMLKRKKPKHPNVVIVLTDDQGYGDLGINGNPYIKTPVIDELARESIILDRFMVCAVCAPTRASLLTGRYHLATGTNWVSRRKEVMNSGEITFAELFKDAGYSTGCFGKWHNGAQFPHNAVGQGFEKFFGFAGGHWNNYFNTELENEKAEKVTTEGYITDVLTDHAIDFINDNKENPFLCYVPYNTPHGPFQVPEKYSKRFEELGLNKREAAILGMCENIDENVGRLMESLKENNLWENTIFIYLTDNGPNGHRYNAGMKGIKATVHEGGLRVPCYLHIPWMETITVEKLTAHIDILPTLAALCNIDIPAGIDIHGRNIELLLEGKTGKWTDRIIYTHNQPWVFEESPAGGVRTEQYRLVFSRENDTSLYDMLKDPFQMTDIKNEHPDVLSELSGLYHDWFMKMTGDGSEPLAEPIEVGHSPAPLVTLPAPDGDIKGGVRYTGKGWANEWAKNFTDDEGCVVWDVKIIKDADYCFLIKYSCPVEDAGFNVIIEANDNKITAALEKLNVSGTADTTAFEERSRFRKNQWQELRIDTMFLTAGNYDIRFRVDNTINPQNRFYMKEVIIKEIE